MANMNDVGAYGRKVYVLYHRNCMDGSGSKFAAYLVFGSRAEYIDVQYREPMPKIEDGSDVYILDFSYSREELIALNARVNKLVVLDHHKTAKKDLEGLPFALFDMKKSGAMMSWLYFHPSKTIPEIISLFDWPDAKVFHAGFQEHREDVTKWFEASRDDEQGRYLRDTVKKNGKVILDYEAAQIQILLKRVKFVRFLHTRVGIVNSSVLKDELAAAIYTNPKNRVHGAIVYTIEPESQKALLSFRGAEGSDWSWVARHLGGGGHERSCNAAVDLATLQQILDGRFYKLPHDTWIGKIRNWINTKLRLWEEALHTI